MSRKRKSKYEEVQILMKQIKPLAGLTEFEEFVFLLHKGGVQQLTLSRLLGVSQPTICYRLQQAEKKLKALAPLLKKWPRMES